jgi:uncharacterized protein (DUF924 family)
MEKGVILANSCIEHSMINEQNIKERRSFFSLPITHAKTLLMNRQPITITKKELTSTFPSMAKVLAPTI